MPNLTEKIKNISKIVAWCTVSAALPNGGLGFVILITFLFTMGDVNSVLALRVGFSSYLHSLKLQVRSLSPSVWLASSWLE